MHRPTDPEPTASHLLQRLERRFPPLAGCLPDEQLACYLDGSLEPAAKAAVESHAAECAVCMQLLQSSVTSMSITEPAALDAIEAAYRYLRARGVAASLTVLAGAVAARRLGLRTPAHLHRSRETHLGRSAMRANVLTWLPFGEGADTYAVSLALAGPFETRVHTTWTAVPDVIDDEWHRCTVSAYRGTTHLGRRDGEVSFLSKVDTENLRALEESCRQLPVEQQPYALGALYEEYELYVEAAALYQRQVTTFPQDRMWLALLGRVQENMGLLQLASVNYARANES